MFHSKLLIMRNDKKIKKNILKNVITQAFHVVKKNINNYLIIENI